MRKILIHVLLLFGVQHIHAQTWEEWFKQKKTQVKYMVEQIGALKVYTQYLEKSYGIAKNGLHIISNIKNKDLGLHRDYFNSLKSVNPRIKTLAKATDIIRYQSQISKVAKSTLKNSKESGEFTSSEIDYLQNVFDHLLSECAKNLDDLANTINWGELQMKDDERIRKIDDIYNDMQDKYSFCKSFSKQTGLLAIQRMKEVIEAEISKRLFGIK